MAVSLVRDARFREHDAGHGHPECPARLAAIDDALSPERGCFLELVDSPARPATREELESVHAAAYLGSLERARGRSQRFDPDTRTSPASIDAAFLAAGGTIDLASRVLSNEVPPGFALVRPPGHHALADRAMGFCFINNVAVAAEMIIRRGLAERVAIYDFDVHHGNGTQAIFYDRKDVLYLSTHQHPFYPGTGLAKETGEGPGEGTTFNVPLPAGTNDATLADVTRSLLVPKVRAFSPDAILLSAGFDGYTRDPLGGFELTPLGFHSIVGRFRDLAESIAHGHIIGVLEGGYALEGLGDCVRAALHAFDGRALA